MVVTDGLGLTVGLAIGFTKSDDKNHVTVPVAQVADNVALWPVQIADALMDSAVGVAGVGVTVTVTLADGLLQVPFTQTA